MSKLAYLRFMVNIRLALNENSPQKFKDFYEENHDRDFWSLLFLHGYVSEAKIKDIYLWLNLMPGIEKDLFFYVDIIEDSRPVNGNNLRISEAETPMKIEFKYTDDFGWLHKGKAFKKFLESERESESEQPFDKLLIDLVDNLHKILKDKKEKYEQSNISSA